METNVKVNGANSPALPAQVEQVIAIAKRVSDECDTNFETVFQAAMLVYYRTTFLERPPSAVRCPE